MKSLIKTVAILALCLLLAMAYLSGTATAATWTNTSVVTVSYDQHNIFMLFAAGDDAQVSYSFNVQLGGRVDILVMDQSNYDAYTVNAPFSYLPGSTLDALSGGDVVLTPVTGDVYYMVIDNTFEPAGGAEPTGSVTVSCTASAFNATLPEEFTDFILIIAIAGIVVAGVFLVIIFLIFFHKPKQTSYPPTMVPGGTRTCPRCGSGVPSEFQFCPKCGNKW